MKNQKINVSFFFLAILFAFNLSAFNGDLRAIVKRPNKNELFVAGEFKTVFVIDSKTGKTKRAFLTKKGAVKLAFNKGGDFLLADNGGSVQFLDPENGELKKTISGNSFCLFNSGSYIISIDSYGKKVNVYSSMDGTLLFTQTCEFQPNFVLLDAEEKELHVFSKKEEIKNEEKLITKKSIKTEGYNVFNNTYMEDQADGKGVQFFTITLSNKTISKTQVLPYSPSKGAFGSAFSSYKDLFHLLTWDSFYKMDKSGNMTPIEYKGAGFSYSATSSKDGKYMIQVGNKKGFVYNCETEKFSPFEFEGAFFKPYSADVNMENDTVYLLSKDYTIDIFTPTGFLIKDFTITFEPNKGKFSVFYYNAFNKKEDRDKEALIINTLLKTLNEPEVDLEVTEPKDKLLASFNSVKEADAFREKLKKAELKYKTMIVPFE